MSLLDKFRKCGLCRKPRPKECAKVVVNGGKEIRICNECEKVLEMSNIAAQGGYDAGEDVDGKD